MGKGGGALSMWIKEFTALVFTQTIQAFIYAIIISIILFGMTSVDGVSAVDNNSALGLMATFALLSVFKVEALAKKIFGISDTKASPGNAMKSIAKTAIAASIGKRVLNNTGKFFGGIGKIAKSRQDNKKVKSRLDEDMKDNGFEMGANGKPNYVGQTTDTSSTALTDSGSADTVGTSSSGASSGGASGGYSEPSGSIAAADKRRMKNALRSYEDQISEIKKARDEGVKDIFSSLSESAGSLVGGTMGGLLGGADGNLDEMLNGIMAGAGIGDTIGKSTVDAFDRAAKFVQRNYKREAGMSHRDIKKAIGSYKSVLEDMTVNHNSANVEEAND